MKRREQKRQAAWPCVHTAWMRAVDCSRQDGLTQLHGVHPRLLTQWAMLHGIIRNAKAGVPCSHTVVLGFQLSCRHPACLLLLLWLERQALGPVA